MKNAWYHEKEFPNVPRKEPSAGPLCLDSTRRSRTKAVSLPLKQPPLEPRAAAPRGEQRPAEMFSIRLRAQEQWFSDVVASTNPDTLFCPTKQPLALGAHTRVDIIYAGGLLTSLDGEVVACRRSGNRGLRPGVSVRVHPRSQRALAFIHAWARHEIANRRRAPRLPLRLLVSYQIAGQRRLNFTGDLSEGGLYVNTPLHYKAGLSVTLRVTDPDAALPIELQGVVVHGSSAPGIGIRLVDSTDEQRDQYLGLLMRLARRYRTAKLAHARRTDGPAPAVG